MSSNRRPVDAKKRALEMNAGSQIHTLLNPLKKDAKTINAPNHALINRQNLKATQVRNQLKKEEATARASEEPFKMNRFKNAESVIKQKVAEKVADNPHSFTKKGEGKGIVAKLGTLSINRTGMPDRNRNSGGNTVGNRRSSGSYNSQSQYQQQELQRYDDEDDEENIYGLQNQGPRSSRIDDNGLDSGRGGDYGGYDDEEGVGSARRYEDGGRFEDEAEEEYSRQFAGNGPSSQQYPTSLPPRQPSTLTSIQPTSNKSYIHQNARNVIQQSKVLASSRSHASDENPNTANKPVHRHDNYGKVPAYLEEAKANLAAKKAEREAEQKEKDLGIPPGMVLMEEEQRLKTLAVLQENHAKVLYDIQSFPLRVETISRKKAKAELEAKLEEIEKAIQLFSRKRVLIQP